MQSWRDKQLININADTVILDQETCLLRFLDSLETPSIYWAANRSRFYEIVNRRYNLTECLKSSDTLVLFKTIDNLTVRQTQSKISHFLEMKNIRNFYVGINRYTFLTEDPILDLPDRLEDSITHIMQQCHAGFTRIADFDLVAGETFVFSHPMDLYTLCR